MIAIRVGVLLAKGGPFWPPSTADHQPPPLILASSRQKQMTKPVCYMYVKKSILKCYSEQLIVKDEPTDVVVSHTKTCDKNCFFF